MCLPLSVVPITQWGHGTGTNDGDLWPAAARNPAMFGGGVGGGWGMYSQLWHRAIFGDGIGGDGGMYGQLQLGNGAMFGGVGVGMFVRGKHQFQQMLQLQSPSPLQQQEQQLQLQQQQHTKDALDGSFIANEKSN